MIDFNDTNKYGKPVRIKYNGRYVWGRDFENEQQRQNWEQLKNKAALVLWEAKQREESKL